MDTLIHPSQIRALRKLRGWTQHDLSVASTVRTAVISRAERGEAIGSDKLEKLTAALGGARIPIGAKDRNGVEICLGDTVRFADSRQWGSSDLPEWVVELRDGQVYQGAGVPSDLPLYCAVIKQGGAT